MRYLIIALFVISPSIAAAADDPKAIIDKSIQAMGGADKLSKNLGEQWKSKGVMHAGDMKIDYTADYTYQAPNKFRMEAAMEVGGQKATIAAASDGTNVWQSGFGVIQDMPEKKAKGFKHSIYTMGLLRLVMLKDKEYTLALADEIKLDQNKPAIGVKVSKKDHPDVTIYFDKESGLPVKLQTMNWHEFTDKESLQESFMLDWKKKDGNVWFYKLHVKVDGKPLLEEEFSDQKLSDKLDPKLFAKP